MLMEDILLLEFRIRQKEKEADALTQAIETLRFSLDAFLSRYYAQVGRLYVDLDQLKLRVQEYRYRLHLYAQDPQQAPDWAGYDAEVDEAFSYQHERIRNLEEELDAFDQTSDSNESAEKETRETDPSLQQLFRKLAFKFHPDRAQTPEERQQFHEIMSRINDAYHRGDLETLRKFERKLSLEERFQDVAPDVLLVRLKNEYDSALQLVKSLRAERERLLSGESYKLKMRVDEAQKSNRDLLRELALDVGNQIEDYRKELSTLIRQAEQLHYPGVVHG